MVANNYSDSAPPLTQNSLTFLTNTLALCHCGIKMRTEIMGEEARSNIQQEHEHLILVSLEEGITCSYHLPELDLLVFGDFR